MLCLGYTYGLTEYAQDPRKMDKVLENQTILNGSKVKDACEVHDKYSPEYRRVSRVAARAIDAAKVLCEVKIADIKAQLSTLYIASGRSPTAVKGSEVGVVNNLVKAIGGSRASTTPSAPLKTPSSAPPTHAAYFTEIMTLESELEQWTKALDHLAGDWKYIVIKDKLTANAFVSSHCPKRIFVLEGFFNILNPTDDELGLVLSHELSHLMLEHASHQNLYMSAMSALLLVVLSFVDPVGFFSIGLEVFGFQAMSMIKQSYSRQCESEADELGLIIASLACFDTKKGVEFFSKLADIEGHKSTQWNHSHPSSDYRHTDLKKKVIDYHTDDIYRQCLNAKSDFLFSSVGLSSKHMKVAAQFINKHEQRIKKSH